MERRTLPYVPAAIVALLLLSGCGDDAGNESDGGTMTDSGSTADTGTTTDSGSTIDTGTPADSGPGPISCGSETCEPLPILFDNEVLNVLPACCLANDGCGVDMTPTVQYEVTVPSECVQPRAPGEPDESCPTYEYRFPLVNGVTDFVGCCLPSGTCGVLADLSSLTLFDANMSIEYELVLENFGCQETAGWFTDAPEPPTCTP